MPLFYPLKLKGLEWIRGVIVAEKDEQLKSKHQTPKQRQKAYKAYKAYMERYNNT